jgi:peptidoglycan/LPS O-acetylase OafA/YrhL
MTAKTARPRLEAAFSRRHDLDWLRIGAVFALIPYHTSRIFDVWEPFYVKNTETSAALTGIRAFFDPWGMPLLFVLAGATTWLALRHRTGVQYLGERVLRLIVPLLFGLTIIVPPQAYLAWLGQGNQGTYWGFLRQYCTMRTGEFMGWTGGFTLGHLWFILFLFVFSLLALPLFLFLKGPTGRRAIGWIAGLSERPAAIFLFVVPFWLTEPLPGPIVGLLNPFSYILLFIVGFVLFADDRFQARLDRSWRWALGLGTITLVAVAVIRFSGIRFAESSWQSTLSDFLRFCTTWAWIVGALGFAQIHLNRPGRLLPYLNSASYPVYILHQTVILVIGFIVVRWETNVFAKFLIIAAAATGGTLALVEVARRWSVTRAMLGMKGTTPSTS